MEDFEKLGMFYLGREYDTETGQSGNNLLLYDSRDLLTHAVCVGMTGSGKTGLCMGRLEEAALDSIPAIVVDPKGDLTNLLLAFPGLGTIPSRRRAGYAQAALMLAGYGLVMGFMLWFFLCTARYLAGEIPSRLTPPSRCRS